MDSIFTNTNGKSRTRRGGGSPENFATHRVEASRHEVRPARGFLVPPTSRLPSNRSIDRGKLKWQAESDSFSLMANYSFRSSSKRLNGRLIRKKPRYTKIQIYIPVRALHSRTPYHRVSRTTHLSTWCVPYVCVSRVRLRFLCVCVCLCVCVYMDEHRTYFFTTGVTRDIRHCLLPRPRTGDPLGRRPSYGKEKGKRSRLSKL